jgi:uncharacterized protein
MPEVIADTSPIQYLHQTNLLDLLPTLYGRILIPQAVVEELCQGRKQGVVLPDPELISWIEIHQVSTSQLIPMIPNLGLGEREVISLAISLSDSLVILDDALARNYAPNERRYDRHIRCSFKSKAIGLHQPNFPHHRTA